MEWLLRALSGMSDLASLNRFTTEEAAACPVEKNALEL